MEEQPVCRITDTFVRKAMLMAGFSEGKSRFVLSERDQDRGNDQSTVVVPLYDAKEYIRKRIPEYGREIHQE